ncbi:hypothetical protein K503DRAFT_777950 [Rhizopogon vinicolor AM-OR11-026]|uniref:Uncharacterized protein n=1 Tax=Rhizopogon vinicolor AM-OR11-026 TaxID=1314800 RepID=A0A1B7MEC3_9AGAM|nr:hypothetical protein K503DRAFT_777950 [Rhizopogon vinicolor AM-OR11-026]
MTSSVNCHHAKFPHMLGPGRGRTKTKVWYGGSVVMFMTNTFGRMRLNVSRGLLLMKPDQVHVAVDGHGSSARLQSKRCGDSGRDMRCGDLHDWFDTDSNHCSTAP